MINKSGFRGPEDINRGVKVQPMAAGSALLVVFFCCLFIQARQGHLCRPKLDRRCRPLHLHLALQLPDCRTGCSFLVPLSDFATGTFCSSLLPHYLSPIKPINCEDLRLDPGLSGISHNRRCIQPHVCYLQLNKNRIFCERIVSDSCFSIVPRPPVPPVFLSLS